VRSARYRPKQRKFGKFRQQFGFRDFGLRKHIGIKFEFGESTFIGRLAGSAQLLVWCGRQFVADDAIHKSSRQQHQRVRCVHEPVWLYHQFVWRDKWVESDGD
jgi:hypothetical protein